jgi:D-serine deaminase-like pyridoxal phosphate-dependent protein
MPENLAYHSPAAPERFASIDRPTLVVDRARAERNIARMAAKAAASGVRFRPHQKTHNNVEIGEWFRAAGVTAITVSSVEHAVRFADAGWDDITIAFPLVTRAMPVIRDLAARVHLGLLVDNAVAIETLRSVPDPVDVWVDVDGGYHRSGVDPEGGGLFDLREPLLGLGRHRLRGVMTHAGNSYKAHELADIREVWRRTAATLSYAAEALERYTGRRGPDDDDIGDRRLEVSVGDTPGCSVMERFAGVDEVRPGNFVFYDCQQLALGVCDEDDLALAVACPIAAVYPQRNEVLIHGGSVQFSRDAATWPYGEHYGRLATVEADGWHPLPVEAGHLRAISQEHGVLRVSPEVLAELRVGDLAFIVPAHACLPANLVRDWLFI